MVEGRLGLIGAICAAFLAIAVGCSSERITGKDLAAAVARDQAMKAKTARQAQIGFAITDLLKTSADRDHDVKVAREGRSEVNINIYVDSEKQRIVRESGGENVKGYHEVMYRLNKNYGYSIVKGIYLGETDYTIFIDEGGQGVLCVLKEHIHGTIIGR